MTAFDRRTFVGGAAAAAGALAVHADPVAAAARRRASRALARDAAFTQGVASGVPATDAITLWTKLDGLEGNARVALEISPDEDFRRVLHRTRPLVRATDGHTVHHRVTGRGLRPGERYFFRFATADAHSPVGRFTTARPADSREPVRIGFFSCQNWTAGHYPAHDALAAEDDLDLVVCLGDYIYENGGDGVRRDRVGKNGRVETLGEYREKYALYHSDPALLEVRRRHPLVAVWDDHEVENNWAGETPGTAGTRSIPFEQRKENGFRAFFEHMPRLRHERDPDRIFGRIPLGGTADVLLLDGRRFRDDQPCGDQVAMPCSEAADPGRTMLGAAQKAWFKRALEGSRARWKIVGNQVMVMAVDYAPGLPLNFDQWDGYAAERRELLEFVRDRGIEDVTFLTGDIHTFFAGVVTPSGRQGPLGTGERPVATEFVGGSISSQGLGDELGGTEDGGRYAGFPIEAGGDTMNPHLRFVNASRKGYGVLEASDEELRVDFRAVRSVARPESEAYTLARFRVPAGEAEVDVGYEALTTRSSPARRPG